MHDVLEAGTWCYFNGQLVVVVDVDRDHCIIVGCTQPDHWKRVHRLQLQTEDVLIKASKHLGSKLRVDQSGNLILALF